MRREAWSALLAVVAWAFFLVASAAAYRPDGPADLVPPLVLAGVPLAVSGWALLRAWRGAPARGTAQRSPTTVPSPGLLRLVAAGLLALVLGAFGLELLGTPASFDFGFEAPISVRPLLPGVSETWAYLAALVLTVGAVAPTPRGGIVVTAILAAGTLVGGVALSASASGAIGSGPGPAAGCAGRIRVIIPPSSISIIVSTGTGEVDGAPIGSARVTRYPGTPATVSYDTRWGSGSHDLGSEDHDAFQALGETLSADRLISADDLGIDAILGSAVRHCRVVIDGRSAVRSFLPLRWLMGADETTADPGAGLEAWRGLLDYWIIRAPVRGSMPGDAGSAVVVAAVRVDGQPRDWPFPGLHATLGAATWFGGL